MEREEDVGREGESCVFVCQSVLVQKKLPKVTQNNKLPPGLKG
jgi:hypothetical protein